MLESVFGPSGLTMKDEDGPHTNPDWDSAMHLNLILALEAEFGVQFPTSEVKDLTSVAKLRAKLPKD